MFKSKKKTPDIEVEIRSKVIHKMRLRERTWFMWFMLVVFFPIGIYLAWKYHPLGKKVIKYYISTVLGVAILSVGITACNGKDSNESDNASTFSITRVERNDTSIPDEELTVVDTDKRSGTWFDFPASEELANYTGLYETDYGWAYLKNGIIDTSYFGLASKEDGTYFVANGFIDWDKGVIPSSAAWFAYPGKEGMENYNGLYETDYGWAYLKDGVIDTSYNGYAANALGIYYVSNGFVDWSKAVKRLGTTTTSTTKKTTIKKTTTTIPTTRERLPWYDYPGSPDLANYTGLYQLADGRWVYLNKGVIDVNYNDWAENEYGGYTVVNGFVDWSKPHYSKTTTTTTRYYTTAQKSSGGSSGSWGSGSSSGSKGNANQNTNSGSYILNTNSGIVHHSWCPSVKRMSEKNKSVVNSTAGYKLCKNCF